jgi:hypothetical protein
MAQMFQVSFLAFSPWRFGIAIRIGAARYYPGNPWTETLSDLPQNRLPTTILNHVMK